ncbi:Fatty acid hydroxylase [Mycena indigotica]|uniref:Fatty acid hydroxylase n=1 Tax=Mycena indigotica TaxID=2126181 RepID=A0A8H6T6A4_9AGAR|nr:Fatty acid hydroxylase [Mycena indigotica]KAF7312568.1 Fatty acid hydroxylase [Mycena indigotica]
MTTPIPQPATVPFLGNAPSVDREFPMKSFSLLAKKYGEIYQLTMPGRQMALLSSYRLVNEVCDEKRFQKRVGGGLGEVRNLTGDGLFTAQPEESNWGIAHRLLMPAFGTLAVKDMMEEMRDITSQLLLKWERFGSETTIDVADDFTRLTLDTIAFCSMSYRLNSFYTADQPEFATAMGDFLLECGSRATRPKLVQSMMRKTNAKYYTDLNLMRELADTIVKNRRQNPVEKHDLLDTMLNSRDPKTGQAMSEESIAQNLLTFLIAGHETSSGMMTFMVYYLLKHPDKMRKLRAQIDEVLGDRPVQYEDFDKLTYLTAVMRETLRLASTAPIRAVQSLEDTTIANGRYAIKKGTAMIILAWELHRDPSVWGEDAEEFKPERMMNGKFEALPPNAWQPFGFGLRACIGRAFAWQEVLLVMASVIQKFDLSFADPSYNLEIKQTLTVKPKGLNIRATLRSDRVPNLYSIPASALMSGRNVAHELKGIDGMGASQADDLKPVYVLYGSNTGTSEGFAQRIANSAPSYGFRASIGTLDSVVEKLPSDGPVIIITASFEGEPADNAAHFFNWLENLPSNTMLANVGFAVFGCGNLDWANTFQRIPTLIDKILAERGATRLARRGSGDAGGSGLFQAFEQWEAEVWSSLSTKYGTSPSMLPASTLEVKTVGKERASALRQADALLGRVVENCILTKMGPVKRHIEFELPPEMSARAGDYVAILPQNPLRDVHRVLARFGLSNEEEVVLSATGPTSLPVGKPVKLSEILTGYVELAQPATTRDLQTLIAASESETTRKYLEQLKANYDEAVQARRFSVFAIIESYRDIQISIGAFLQMLPSMRVRQYSISSSPLWNPSHITITLSILDAPAFSGTRDVPFLGVGSNYLASLIPGDRVQMIIRPSATAFHLPEDPFVPIVMFCSGAGLAPFRGFIQERAAQKSAGRAVGKMLLFFGCRSPEWDYLYSDSDLKEWAANGVVDIRPAFSRAPHLSEGCKYVQDRVWKDNGDIQQAFADDALFFTCGSSAVAKGIKKTLIDIIQVMHHTNEEDATQRFQKIVKGRYATDVFD